MAKSSPTLIITTQIRLQGKQPILQEMIKTSWSRTITSSQKVLKYKKESFHSMQYVDLHQPLKPVLLTVRGMKRLKPHPIQCVFMAFVLPLSLGSWIKGVHDYTPSSSTMCSEGPRGEILISLLRGFPEDFYSLGIFDNPLAPHKN